MRLVSPRNLPWAALAAFAAMLASGQTADASLVLRLTDLNSGAQQILIDNASPGAVSDGGHTATAADFAGTADGAVLYVGDVGSFHFSVTTGVSKPIIGSAINKRLDSVSLVVSGGVGLLQVELTDTDFAFTRGGGSMILTSSIGGTTDGIVTAQSFVGLSNQEFGTEITPGEQGPYGSVFNGSAQNKSFSGFARTMFNLEPEQLFSLTQRVTVQHFHNGGGDETTSFDIMTEVHAPEPTTFALWGIGLGCVGMRGWRRRPRHVAS